LKGVYEEEEEPGKRRAEKNEVVGGEELQKKLKRENGLQEPGGRGRKA